MRIALRLALLILSATMCILLGSMVLQLRRDLAMVQAKAESHLRLVEKAEAARLEMERTCRSLRDSLLSQSNRADSAEARYDEEHAAHTPLRKQVESMIAESVQLKSQVERQGAEQGELKKAVAKAQAEMAALKKQSDAAIAAEKAKGAALASDVASARKQIENFTSKLKVQTAKAQTAEAIAAKLRKEVAELSAAQAALTNAPAGP